MDKEQLQKHEPKIKTREIKRHPWRIAGAIAVLGVTIIALFNMTVVSSKPHGAGLASAAGNKQIAPKRELPPFFATAEGTELRLRLPAPEGDVIGIGYHQAYNVKALGLDSSLGLQTEPTSVTISRASVPGRPVSFVMEARGRGSGLNSAVDIAVKDGIFIKSPVSGRVEAVKPYLLYGSYDDVQVDIVPDSYPELKISMIHLDDIRVKLGQKVEAGVTLLARPRKLAVDSQIDQYLGKASLHIHLQINPRDSEKTPNGD
jgi:murein DD-endopeptidase MepM/ murein hydrolase activator NlpD